MRFMPDVGCRRKTVRWGGNLAIRTAVQYVIEEMERRTLLSGGVAPTIVNALADNRGMVTLNLSSAEALQASTVTANSVEMFTAGPSGDPADADHANANASVQYSAASNQIVVSSPLAANTSYEIVVISDEILGADGVALDGSFNGATEASGDGSPGTTNYQFVATATSSSNVAVFYTSLGQMDVQLQSASQLPQTIANFLDYANGGYWDGTFVHRETVPSTDGIGVIQAGGFNLSGNTIGTVANVTTPSTGIPLEAGIPNTLGTIAMARAANPNTATDEFFFNDVDNSSDLLDNGSGNSYCAFGTITNANGLAVLSAIAGLTPVNLSAAINDQTGTFSEVPTLNNATAQQAANNLPSDLVLINRVAIAMNVASTSPTISGVTATPVPISGQSYFNWAYTINGLGFGTQSPFSGDSPDIRVQDVTAEFTAGDDAAGEDDAVGVNVTRWTDTQIIIAGYTGDYGTSFGPSVLGDVIEVTVTNPASDDSSTVYTFTLSPITQNSGGTVTAMGGNTSGTSNISVSNGQVLVNVQGVTQSFTTSSVTGINVLLGNGSQDSLSIAAGVPAVSVLGGTGSDTVIAKNSAADYIVGGSGTDMLKAGKGFDTVAAGTGNNTTVHGGAGADLILDGSGSGDSIIGGLGLSFAQYNPNSTMSNVFEVFDPPKPTDPPVPDDSPNLAAESLSPFDGSAVTAAIVNGVLLVTGAPGSNKMVVTLNTSGLKLKVVSDGTTIGAFPTASISGVKIIGGPDSDTLKVNSSVTLPATLKGGGGGDSLVGGGGNNVLVGGTGNSILKGGAGVNLLVPGKRVAFASTGPEDTLIGGGGLSIADFSHRTDPLYLSNDNQANSGDAAAGETDEIMSSVTAIWGGTGGDTIVGTIPGEFLSGGAGKNTIQGGGATDVLLGGDGKDTVVAAAEPVSIYLDLNKPGEYGGIANPAEDILQVSQSLDTLLPS
jgi:cyclophilin family peptidyl-prolyl cis-trans isomerase